STSFDSVNGPSVTVALPPANLTRAPVAGGCSPSSASTTPALVSDSLYLVILATRSAGGAKPAGAFSYPLGITSIMNRMALNSFRVRSRPLQAPTQASSDTPRNRHAHLDRGRRGASW